MALSDRIGMALAGPRRDHPIFDREAAQVRLRGDVAVDLSVDAVEFIEPPHRHRDVAFAKIHAANLAVVLIAQAKLCMRHWRKRRFFEDGLIELNTQCPWIAENRRLQG